MRDQSEDVAYLAAQYSRHAEMRKYRDQLATIGIIVSSRWIDQHSGTLLTSFEPEQLNSDPEHCAKYAKADLEDLMAAGIVINFTSIDGGGKGGRHWEMGWAYGRRRLLLVGPREHVFHTLPEVEHYDDWSTCFMALKRNDSCNI